MGVPKLLTTLAPFGDRKPLDNGKVIIDGPALAYHIVGLCMADPVMAAGRRHPLEQSTYAQLGEAATAWLDTLCSRHNITVLAIYFDGYLPVAKRPVRLERSYRTSAQLKDAFSFYQRDNLPGFDAKGPRTGSLLPAPAFAVPAVLDALRASATHYKTVTHVVPGEADAFCAWHARNIEVGTVLTSDSDLLVQDLGPDGEVVLMRDIDLPRGGGDEAGAGSAATKTTTTTTKRPLIVLAYRMAAICQRLGLPAPVYEHDYLANNKAMCQQLMKSGKGLYGFAFELLMDPCLSTSELVGRAKQGLAMAQHPDEYAEFVDQYTFPEALNMAVQQYNAGGLDPRVAEVVFQSVLLGGDSQGYRGDALLKPADLPMLFFAPPLVDDCMQANAWEISAPIRVLAFSLLRRLPTAANMGDTWIREYARMASMASRGTALELLPAEGRRRVKALDNFISLLTRIQAFVPASAENSSELQWVTLASYYDIEWSKEHAKPSACLDVLQKETPSSGVLEQVTWTGMHWLAQIQGTLYSLRILQQIVAFVKYQQSERAGDDKQLWLRIEALEGMLSTLTPLAKYPTLRTLRDLPARLKTANALEVLVALAELPASISFKPPSGSKTSKNRNRNKKRKRTGHAPVRVRTMTNPFTVLDGAD
ncbi:hypothetical protein SPBR_05732 [Sporothrix brasiliensis 5110]|uniref:Asteroid domain-containing protein n=1 Tax=Sporothrix brasiliensis 5110 TaxID=1398154 RepID=A0A0C2F4V3_9PEZI|nr:uncharacterized protein SPBR_05732 [Sporothrix brasiliensis 5110]KIH93949.1 hypothetical protein SPBR_05732 [Sporothrix brasiliensis 5110]